jgi:hypothetical protein
MTIPNLVTTVGNRMIVSPFVHQSLLSNPFTAETRHTPVLFSYAWRTQDTVTIAIPEGYTVSTLPDQVVVRDEPFVLTVAYTGGEKEVTMTRRLDVNTAEWPVADYPRLKAFFEKVYEANRTAVTLTKAGA